MPKLFDVLLADDFISKYLDDESFALLEIVLVEILEINRLNLNIPRDLEFLKLFFYVMQSELTDYLKKQNKRLSPFATLNLNVLETISPNPDDKRNENKNTLKTFLIRLFNNYATPLWNNFYVSKGVYDDFSLRQFSLRQGMEILNYLYMNETYKKFDTTVQDCLLKRVLGEFQKNKVDFAESIKRIKAEKDSHAQKTIMDKIKLFEVSKKIADLEFEKLFNPECIQKLEHYKIQQQTIQNKLTELKDSLKKENNSLIEKIKTPFKNIIDLEIERFSSQANAKTLPAEPDIDQEIKLAPTVEKNDEKQTNPEEITNQNLEVPGQRLEDPDYIERFTIINEPSVLTKLTGIINRILNFLNTVGKTNKKQPIGDSRDPSYGDLQEVEKEFAKESKNKKPYSSEYFFCGFFCLRPQPISDNEGVNKIFPAPHKPMQSTNKNFNSPLI